VTGKGWTFSSIIVLGGQKKKNGGGAGGGGDGAVGGGKRESLQRKKGVCEQGLRRGNLLPKGLKVLLEKKEKNIRSFELFAGTLYRPHSRKVAPKGRSTGRRVGAGSVFYGEKIGHKNVKWGGGKE